MAELRRQIQKEFANQHLQSQAVFAKQHDQLIIAGSNLDQSFYPSQNLENSKMNIDDLQSFGGKENVNNANVLL